MAAKRPEPKHGSLPRYRRGCRCDRCRAANSRAKRLERARAKGRGGSPLLTLVQDPPPDTHSTPTDAAHDAGLPDAPAAPPQPPRYYGTVEDAVAKDLAEIVSDVPMHRTLRAMAQALAREIDDMDGKGSKAALHNQLLDVVTKLRGDRDGEGDGDDALIAALSQPIVPGAS